MSPSSNNCTQPWTCWDNCQKNDLIDISHKMRSFWISFLFPFRCKIIFHNYLWWTRKPIICLGVNSQTAQPQSIDTWIRINCHRAPKLAFNQLIFIFTHSMDGNVSFNRKLHNRQWTEPADFLIWFFSDQTANQWLKSWVIGYFLFRSAAKNVKICNVFFFVKTYSTISTIPRATLDWKNLVFYSRLELKIKTHKCSSESFSPFQLIGFNVTLKLFLPPHLRSH